MQPNNHISQKQGCPKCGREAVSEKISLPFDKFIRRARKAHGKKYEYDEASYARLYAKLTIICPAHGPFKQLGSDHINGHGCPVCGRESTTAKRRLSFTEFVKRARNVHGSKYKYDKATYTHSEAKLTIICPEHGGFTQLGGSHLQGRGCPACARERAGDSRRITFAEFLRRSREAHGDKYKYDESSYTIADNKLTIICPKHGPFRQSGDSHMQGKGCDRCAHELVTEKRKLPFADFLRRARKIHGRRYSYDESSYAGVNSELSITCPKHGKFEQTAYHHTQGSGCPKCGAEKSMKTRRLMRQKLKAPDA